MCTFSIADKNALKSLCLSGSSRRLTVAARFRCGVLRPLDAALDAALDATLDAALDATEEAEFLLLGTSLLIASFKRMTIGLERLL